MENGNAVEDDDLINEDYCEEQPLTTENLSRKTNALKTQLQGKSKKSGGK